ncbi:MAG: hypothetical protein NW215_10450 [Hyphomicrobiales bacterium]|nr:hypothetical protein [Hyphomicrobiales bacterium]
MSNGRTSLTGLGAAMIWCALTTCAFAFSETKTPPLQPVPGVSIEEGAADKPKSEQTEINIPGIGSIGALPKLDFGLDLLYGATPDEPTDAAPKSDDVIIRGTIKHKF